MVGELVTPRGQSRGRKLPSGRCHRERRGRLRWECRSTAAYDIHQAKAFGQCAPSTGIEPSGLHLHSFRELPGLGAPDDHRVHAPDFGAAGGDGLPIMTAAPWGSLVKIESIIPYERGAKYLLIKNDRRESSASKIPLWTVDCYFGTADIGIVEGSTFSPPNVALASPIHRCDHLFGMI